MLVCVLKGSAQNMERIFSVYLESENGVEPSCEVINHPQGLQGTTVHSNYVRAKVTIVDGSDTLFCSRLSDDGFGAKFKVRGNTSALGEKKPYKIKLEKKADLLFRDPARKDKEWALLAGDFLEQMKTIVGLQFNTVVGMDYCPMWNFCKLFVNGQDRGIYLLTETVKKNNDCRVKVDSTGFLAEYDAYWWDEDYAVGSNDVIKFTFKYPEVEDMTEGDKTYIGSFLNAFLQSVSGKNYTDYIDVESFALWLLVQDILGSSDSMGANLFFTKNDNTPASKLKMGPLWDFGSMGRNNSWARQHVSNTLFFKQLLSSSNVSFYSAYRNLWFENKARYEAAISDFLRCFEQSPVAASLAEIYGETEYTNATSFMANWFETRFPWIDANINAVIYQGVTHDDGCLYDLLGRQYSHGKTKTLFVNRNRKLYVAPR